VLLRLMILHGVLSIVSGLGLLALIEVLPAILPTIDDRAARRADVPALRLAGVASAVLGVITLIGAHQLQALQRRGLSLVCCLLGLAVPLTCGVLPTGPFMAITGAIVLTARPVREVYERVAAGTPAGWAHAEIAEE